MDRAEMNEKILEVLLKEQRLTSDQVKQLVQLIEDYQKHCEIDDNVLQKDIQLLQSYLMNE
jgi:hypothetical protein